MPASNAFNLARTSAIGGLFPGTSASGDPTFAKWVIDALDGNSGFDILTYGDSNIGFNDQNDITSGITDGLARGLETLGVPLYGTPVKPAGALTARLGLYFQDFINNRMFGTTGCNFDSTTATISSLKTLTFTGASLGCAPLVGMQVAGTGIAGNTFITAVSGLVATLSNNCTNGTVNNGGMWLSSYGSDSRVTCFDSQVADFSSVISPVSVTVTVNGAVTDTCIVALNISGGTIPGTRYCYVSPDNGVTKIKILGKVDSVLSGELLGAGTTGTYILSKKVTLTNGQSLTIWREDPGLHLSGGSYNNAFPTQVPQDDILIIPPSNASYSKQVTVIDTGQAPNYWPAGQKGKVIGRVVLGTAPGGDPGPNVAHNAITNFVQIQELDNASNSLGTYTGPVSSTVGSSGGYIVAEAAVPANAARAANGVFRLYFPGGEGSTPLNNGSIALCMASMYSPIVGFGIQTMNYKGGATTTSCLADLVALDAYNSMKKVQLFMKEVVDRQRAASVKNSGRVVIAIQAGTNFDAGGDPLGRGIAFIDNVAAIQRLLKKAWKLAGQPEAQLCFLVMFGPVVTADGVVNGADSPVTRNYIKANAGKLLNTLYIDHATNLPFSTYQAESLWDTLADTSGSAFPAVHLHGSGNIRWGKVLAANTVLHLKRIFKTKK